MTVTMTYADPVHGTTLDPEFVGEDANHAAARDAALEAQDWLRDELVNSERFTSEVRLEGEVIRGVDLIEAFLRRSFVGGLLVAVTPPGSPDYVGMEKGAPADGIEKTAVAPGEALPGDA